jgi:hypothetical protein
MGGAGSGVEPGATASGDTHDAYVAIRPYRARSHGECSGPDSFVFVDNSIEGEHTAIRRLPVDVLRNPQATLLIRANEEARRGARSEEADRIEEVIQRWGLEMPVGLLHQPCGERAWVEEVSGVPRMDLARARAVELEALLKWGKAIWLPEDYHYRLPSGEHAAGFVKLADAIREPRDAEVLASWLAPHLRKELGFVLDTGTMTPVFEAVARRMTAAGMPVGPVAVLEHYPRSSADVDDAVELAAGDKGRVLALLSVNSSGSVRDRLLTAMGRVPGLSDPQLVVLIDKDRPTDRPQVETWSPLPGDEPLIRRGAAARETCPLCAGGKRSRLVPINPYTFDGMSQGELRPVMPSVNDARANSDFWQECGDGEGSIAVESRSEVEGSVARPDSGRMTLRVEVDGLLEGARFRRLARDRLERLAQPLPASDPLRGVRWSREPLRPNAELVLVPEHELAYPGFDAFWKEIASAVAAPDARVRPFPLRDQFGSELKGEIGRASGITIFALGAVSGHSLQRALYSVQAAHRGREYDLQGLVLHARLPSVGDWRTLCNSFGEALHAAWIAFLPERSPLRQERDVLKPLPIASYKGVVAEFLDERLRLCAGEIVGSKPPLFWGAAPHARLSENSIFGQRLDARTTFAAVAAAMARARIDHAREVAPELRVFDLAGMIRSYYDPLIIASFLRWLGPYEGWWGWQAWEAERTINTLFDRTKDDDAALHVLVPELLLATAQGKVHDAAVETIRAQAERVLRDMGPPPRVGAAIELGLDLAEKLSAVPDEGPAPAALAPLQETQLKGAPLKLSIPPG